MLLGCSIGVVHSTIRLGGSIRPVTAVVGLRCLCCVAISFCRSAGMSSGVVEYPLRLCTACSLGNQLLCDSVVVGTPGSNAVGGVQVALVRTAVVEVLVVHGVVVVPLNGSVRCIEL